MPPYTYAWTFPNGAVSTQQNPTYTFRTEGTYTVAVVVRDRKGITGRATTTVHVAGQLFGNNPL